MNITKELNIPEIVTESIPEDLNLLCTDPIDLILLKYKKHPSLLKISEHVNTTRMFSFDKVNPSHIENQILELNSKKAVGVDAIPARVLKDSVSVLKLPLTLLFNSSVNENLFPHDLKYADVAPLFKKDDNTNKENYRPVSIL